MSENEKKGLLDHAVELLAKAMDALGLNGTRLRWKWSRRRLKLGEAGAQASVLLRSARGRHKMCPSCRSLVPRTARTCPDCGTGLSAVTAPGVGRLFANVFPGTTATTSLIMLVNGLIFLLMMMDSLRSGHQVGIFGAMSGEVFWKYGAANAGAVFQLGDWWRLVTAMFLHGGLLHFGFNSMALLGLGPLVEGELGTERFWIVYLSTGFFGNLTHVFIERRFAVVGASVAICGLVGLLIAYGSRVRTRTSQNLKAAMLRFTVMIVIISLLPGVSWQGHLGGFLAGLGLGWIIPVGQFRSRQSAAGWRALSLAGVILVLFCFFQLTVRG